VLGNEDLGEKERPLMGKIQHLGQSQFRNACQIYHGFIKKIQRGPYIYNNKVQSSDAKASKCHLKFSSLMMIFIKLVYLSSVILPFK